MKRTVGKIAMAGLVLAAGAALAAEDEAVLVGYRQKVMKGIGANTAAIGDILKFKLPYEKNVLGHAQALHADALLAASAFEKKADSPKSMAKPEVWQKPAEFKEHAEHLVEASAKLVKVAEGGDMKAIGAQMKELGKACQDCHDDFRKPDEEKKK